MSQPAREAHRRFFERGRAPGVMVFVLKGKVKQEVSLPKPRGWSERGN
jgi:hypothetical protein